MALSIQEEEEIKIYLQEFNVIKNNVPYLKNKPDIYKNSLLKRLEFIDYIFKDYMKKHEKIKELQYNKERKEIYFKKQIEYNKNALKEKYSYINKEQEIKNKEIESKQKWEQIEMKRNIY